MSQEAIKIAPKMSDEDRKALEDQIREDELILANPDKIAAAEGVMGNRQMRDSVRRKKDALGRDEDLIAKGDEKDRIYKRIKELEIILKQNMPSRNEMWSRLGTDDSNTAVQKNMYYHKKFAREIQEVINLKRRLEPSDPQAGSLERIRPT
jgi:hypothetical protein